MVFPEEGLLAGARPQFGAEHRGPLGRAIDLAEEVVSEHFRFSETFWREKARWELKTLAELEPAEITDQALAQIIKYSGPDHHRFRAREFFRICLQDHRLLAARMNAGLDFLTLLCYVIVHELIHVVRFARHDQLFEAPSTARLEEELLVHDLAVGFLKPLALTGADKVFEYAAPKDGALMDITRRL